MFAFTSLADVGSSKGKSDGTCLHGVNAPPVCFRMGVVSLQLSKVEPQAARYADINIIVHTHQTRGSWHGGKYVGHGARDKW